MSYIRWCSNCQKTVVCNEYKKSNKFEYIVALDLLVKLSDKLEYKEQECKNNEIVCRQELENFNQECINMQQQLIEAVDELDQLKAKNETYKKMLDNPEVRVALIDVRTGEREVWRKLGRKAQTYKQALDEIEKLLDSNSIETLDGKILDIINKAKDGE